MVAIEPGSGIGDVKGTLGPDSDLPRQVVVSIDHRECGMDTPCRVGEVGVCGSHPGNGTPVVWNRPQWALRAALRPGTYPAETGAVTGVTSTLVDIVVSTVAMSGPAAA